MPLHPSTALTPKGPAHLAKHFGAYRRLSVRQRKNWTEILLSFEAKNAYDVHDEEGMPVLHVQEIGQGFGEFLRRVFLGPLRPFTTTVTEISSSMLMLELRRPFRWFLHRLEVYSQTGELLGAIQKRWSWVRRIYSVEDANGNVVAELFGPVLRPWTFEVRLGDRTVGMIQKKWSGIGREMFTDADNFGVELGEITDPTLKALVFAATVLLDVVHFERSKS